MKIELYLIYYNIINRFCQFEFAINIKIINVCVHKITGIILPDYIKKTRPCAIIKVKQQQ